MGVAESLSGLTVADVMLRQPKTLPDSARVSEVRAMLANPSVQMILLADERVFRGAITALPDDAPDDDRALDYADLNPDSLPPTGDAATAFQLASENHHRRVVVLDEDGELLGLVCLNATRTGFCGVASSHAVDTV